MSSPTTDYTTPLSTLEIHLDQVRWNYLSLQKRLTKGTDCAAAVKGDAYGLGAAAVVPELYKANCRHFFVAHVSEGFAVREALKGDEAHVYVLHGPYGATPEEFVQANLTPVLNTPGDIAYWSAFAKKSAKKLPAVLQVDTGMNRLGLAAAEVMNLDNQSLKSLDVRYVMSHLACADEADHPQNKEQLEKFKKITAALGLPCRLSLANSSGIFLGPDYHFDMARPGCALYGINPQSGVQNQMQGAVTLKARILQMRTGARGDKVGYGGTYQVPKEAKLATISIGYADGYLRSLSGCGSVYVAGRKCPIVGRVSMDLIVADVTGTETKENDWAEIIGPHLPVDEVAKAAGTIGYEILTDLGKRYTRIYSGRE